MSDFRHSLTARPWLAPAFGAVAVFAMLLVPFSYQKTVAYDVSFHLDGSSAQLAPGLSSAIQKSFGATSINANADGNGGLTLVARIPSELASGVAARAEVFASALGGPGQTVTTKVEPIQETVSGNLFAMTRDQVVRVDITATGRTPEEIKADVRSQLEAAGVTGADVTVSQDEKQTTIQIMNAHEGGAAHASGDGGNFEFTVDGKTPDPASMASIRIENDGRKLSDAELKRSVEDQLRAQGHPAEAVVQDGKIIRITPIKN